MSIFELFSYNVRLHCGKNGLTQEDLAHKTQIDPGIIASIWEGKHDADFEAVALIAAALKVNAFELFLEDGWGFSKLQPDQGDAGAQT